MKNKLVELVDASAPRVQTALAKMRKAGEADFRQVGFQGPAEWFLIERPVSLEVVRDAAVQKEGDIPLGQLQDDLGFKSKTHLTKMLDELVIQGIIIRYGSGREYRYERPKRIEKLLTNEERKDNRRQYSSNGIAGTGRRGKLSSDKEVQQILAKAEAQGAQTKKQGNNHILVEYNGASRVLAATPGDSNRSNREKLKDLGINV